MSDPGGVAVVVSDPGGVAVVVSDPGGVGAGVSVGCVGACLRFFLNIFGLHVAVFGVSSYYMEKLKPGGSCRGGSCREAWVRLVFGFC